MRARYWTTVTLAGFAIYTVIAVLGTLSTAAYWNQAHIAYDLHKFVANRFLEQYTCALFVAPLFWLVQRFPLTRTNRARHAAILSAAIVAFVLVKYAIMVPLYRVWAGEWGSGYWLTVLDNAVPVAFDFAAIVGVAHALRYYRDAAERERRAAELETQLVRSRLDALRGQLHPHFIFNTLNAAATLMHEDVNGADQMLSQLGDLLRTSLDRSAAEVTLDEELGVARRYLAIMQRRFSDRLTVEYAADASVRHALVPTFFMQPLLENALEHGIARRPGPGRLAISARRDDGTLEVVVEDDGPGIVASAVSSSGIGLSNTRARLEHLYGGSQAFVLETSPHGGARAVVRIPFRECAVS